MTPGEIVIHRCRWLGKYMEVARELKSWEQSIKESMPADMRRIMSSKRLALLERILVDEGYPDLNLFRDLCSGFDLVGEIPSSGGVLPAKLAPATVSVEDLGSIASKQRAVLRNSSLSSGDPQLDKELYDKTMSEVDQGWLCGLVDWNDLELDAVVSKRFGLKQGPKLRPIDDYCMSSVNATVTSRDQATADNVDTICAMLRKFVDELDKRSRACGLEARSFDLSAANRQLCVSASSRRFSKIYVLSILMKEGTMFFPKCACRLVPKQL